MRGRAQVIFTVSLVAALSLLGCRKPLKKPEAERLLRSANFLAETATTRLVLYRNFVFPAADLIAEHRDMVKFMDLGLVAVQPNEVWLGKPIGARFVLTSEGERSAASGWQHTSGSGGEDAWIVPTARKELVQVREPVDRGQFAECTFVWKWIPTKVGDKTGAPKGSETFSARFHLEGDEWYLDESSIGQFAAR
ncbi:MAG TPA: hypothetical protein VKK31_29220 [Thermoanaerobaculia bacterium]|nr:hypothetical protein [Thermoanaerobaculia bacterium]